MSAGEDEAEISMNKETKAAGADWKSRKWLLQVFPSREKAFLSSLLYSSLFLSLSLSVPFVPTASLHEAWTEITNEHQP